MPNIENWESASLSTAGVFTGTGFVGPVTGDITGNVAGDVVGDLVGNVFPESPTLHAASGAISPLKNLSFMDSSGGALAMTIATDSLLPEVTIVQTVAGNDAVVTFTSATINVTGNNTATFNAVGEALKLRCVASDLWVIISNVGGVALSTV